MDTNYILLHFLLHGLLFKMYGAMEETGDTFNVFDDSDDEFDYLPLPDVDEVDDTGTNAYTPSKLAYKSVYNPPLPFDSTNRRCFIPNKKVSINIDRVVTDSSQILNPNVYHIEIEHGDHKWCVNRRYKDFQALHNDLLIYKTKSTLLPVMSKQARERRNLFASTNPKLSRFPKRPDVVVRSSHQQEERKRQLQGYLESVLSSQVFRSHPHTASFLDVSGISFICDMGPKRKEGLVKKKAGGRRFSTHCCSCCVALIPGKWLKRWLVLKDSFIAYVRPEDGRMSDVLLMDQDFNVNFGIVSTGWRQGLLITNLSRYLRLKTSTQRDARDWYEDIKQTMTTTGNDFTQANRFRSFVPVRAKSYCNWYVDGASYMSAVADGMEAAKEEIFITDWMLSPELYLKRPFLEGNKWRLDQILKRKAEQGVKIFVLVYKELEVALGINSVHTKKVLSSMHPTNIKVVRHPDGISMWSHHEKSVVVDQRIAFLGGIDLCYGRWDTRKHRLTDLGTIQMSSIYSEEEGDRLINSRTNLRPLPTDSQPHPSHLSPTQPQVSGVGDIIVAAAKRNSGVVDEDVLRVIQGQGPIDRKKEGYVNPLHEDDRLEHLLDGPFSQSDTSPQPVKLASPESSEEDSARRSLGASTDNLPSTLRAFLDVAGSVRGNTSAFQTPSHASHSTTTIILTDHKAPEMDDEKTHIDAFKAYLGRDEDGDEGKHKDETHSWFPDKMKKALDKSGISKLGEWSRRKGSDDDDSDSEVGKDGKKKKRFGWVGDKMRFGGVADDISDKSDHSDNETVVETPAKTTPRDTGATSKRNLLRNVANLKVIFHRHQSQTVDVADDNAERPWNTKIFSQREVDETDSKLDDKLPPEGTEDSLKVWVGKDYCNFIVRDFAELDNPFADLINRREIPRMPWHDVASVVCGKAARDVARHFIQRWNFTKLQKAKMNPSIPLLLPKSNEHVSIPKWVTNNTFCADCQILRSASEWSAGIKHTENSIHNAYTDLIISAQHYIYMENQFFISIAGDRTVSNQISAALYERIVSAHRARKRFKVYVIIPLLPCFEGQLGTASGASIQAIIHWNYVSICRGNGNSLLEKLLKVVPDPFQYISFYGLRRHDEMLGKLTTELIYVHAKLMIVDDRSVIIGSANINDRSMLGSRDSELAILVEDTNFVPGVMDSKPYQAGAFASSLRKSLFREHLGLGAKDDSIDVSDPLSEALYKGVWMKTAAINTSIFWKVFNCIPSDDILTLEDLRGLLREATLAESDPEEARVVLQKVKGHLVLLPLQFLSKENLIPPTGSKEALIPTVVWT